MAPDELRQCPSLRRGIPMLQCQGQVTEMTTHDGDHWAYSSLGNKTFWVNSLYPGYGDLDAEFAQEEAALANPDRTRFETRDSGVRAEFESGMVRDSQEGKARFELLLPLGVPYEEQFLTRVAELMARGAEKYDSRNWEQASGAEELERFKASAFRHFMQWMTGEADEDHAAAVAFNLLGYETTKYKIEKGQ